MKELLDIWSRTQDARSRVQDTLKRLGVDGAECTPCWSDDHNLVIPSDLSFGSDLDVAAQYLDHMFNVKSAAFNGFYLLNLTQAIDKENFLINSLQNSIGDIPFKQMAAFKANHSALLQYLRLLNNPAAGIDVAGVREAISACSLGFDPQNIIYSNPNFNERDLMICSALGISTFCFDHPAKLDLVTRLANHDIDIRSVKMILRLLAPFANASLDFERFGLDVEKNMNLSKDIVQRADRAGLPLTGVSFHIGAGARSFVAYENAFDFAANLFKIFPQSNSEKKILNIGGGFSFTDIGHRHYGSLSVDEQVKFIGFCAKKLNSEVLGGIEIWSEIGQGYVGGAGSVFTRVDVCEKREYPDRYLNVTPVTGSGVYIWGHPTKKIFTRTEQWLTGLAGAWSFPLQRVATIVPEVWGLSVNGVQKKIEAQEHDLIPTLVFGKTCDPVDAINPVVNGEYVRFLLPDLSKFKYSQYALRFCSGAYMDLSGDFNGQTVRSLPWHYILEKDKPLQQVANKSTVSEEWDFRDRLLNYGILTSIQIQQTKELVANQFIANEQMISWLIRTKQLSSEREIMSLRYLLWEKVSSTVDTGLSVVRLKVPRGRPDNEGTVVAAVTATTLDHAQIQDLPHNVSKDWERRITRVVFEVEAIMLRRLARINGGLQEKIFPTCYIAMSAKKLGESGSTLELRQRVHDLAIGAGLKSVTNVATGEHTTRLSQQHPNVTRVLSAVYKDISFYDKKPFEGIRFGDNPGQLSCFVRDFRGPHQYEDPLPQNEMMRIRVQDRGFKDPDLTIFYR